MDAINKLLDKAREMRSIPSDIALAAELGVVRSAVSNYRHGRAYPDTVTTARLAELTGEPLNVVMGVIGEARALSKEEKQVWRRLASAAAVACLMLFPVAGLPSSTRPNDRPAVEETEQDAYIGIMRNWIDRALTRLRAFWRPAWRLADASPLLA